MILSKEIESEYDPFQNPVIMFFSIIAYMDALVALGITNYALWIVRNTRSALFTKNGCTVCKSAMKVLKRLGEYLVNDAFSTRNQDSKSIS